MNKKTARVLSIEDNPQVSAIIVEILKDVGIEAVAVSTGEDGLRVAAAEPFDLILLDIRLPGMNGYEVCRALKQREKTRQVPVVFVTGEEASLSHFEVGVFGACDIVLKPFDPDKLIEVVKRHLPLSE